MKPTMNEQQDEVDGGDVSEEEQTRYPRAASVDKLVDFCAEEFGNLFISCVLVRPVMFLFATFFVFFAHPNVF